MELVYPGVLDGSITTVKLADGAVTAAKLASNTVPEILGTYLIDGTKNTGTDISILTTDGTSLYTVQGFVQLHNTDGANWEVFVIADYTVKGVSYTTTFIDFIQSSIGSGVGNGTFTFRADNNTYININVGTRASTVDTYDLGLVLMRTFGP